MNKKIMMWFFLSMFLISGAFALVTSEFGQGIIRGDTTIFKGEVTEKNVKDTSFNEKNYTLQQFSNINLDNYDFKITYTNEVIFDKKARVIYFVYTGITGEPIYTNETLSGMISKKYEIRMKHSYDRWEACREGKLVLEEQGLDFNGSFEAPEPTVEYCKQQGINLTTSSLENRLERQRNKLKKLQYEARTILGEILEDEVYEDFINA